MHEDFFDKGMQIKRDLRLLGATLVSGLSTTSLARRAQM